MARLRRFFLSHLFFVFALVSSGLARAQAPTGQRIVQRIDDQQRITLAGNVHPLAQPRFDHGAVADSFLAQRMLLLLQRAPEKEAALRQFLEDVHTPGSPNYHHWLTPEQFGRAYGPDDSDVAAVTAWLQSHGFSVASVTKGKSAIEFSGNAGQIRDAFQTEIHRYVVDGIEHHANNRDPQIPAALATVVAGITPMNDFRPRPNLEVLGQAAYDPKTRQATPKWTWMGLPSPVLPLAPGDFAVQYDLNPLYSSGINGAGVTIGIIGDSNVDPAIVGAYRTLFGLPAAQLNVIIDGADPGRNGAVIESYLDVEEAGAIAPGATINLYTAAGTDVQDGLFLESVRAVDDDVAAVLSTSYGLCEQELGTAGNQFWAALWEQAAAQGQTSLVSSGDGGSAGCDNFNLPQPAKDGLAVSGFASTPWNIAVGGTDFYYSNYNGTASQQNSQLASYWNLTATNRPVTSLLTPIPEQPWNNAFGLNLYTGGVYNPAKMVTIVGGSGGVSSCTAGTSAANGTIATCSGGYPKPSWQSGPGVPSDGARDLPDVSLFAANQMNDSFYPICSGYDNCAGTNGAFSFTGVGGTSASSPAFAGIMALVNQKYGRQGQANYTLYPLAVQHPGAFHDVTVGSNNEPCSQGSPNCSMSALTDNTKGFYTLGKYYAGAGYDLATGLGSVDANLLVQYWNSLSFTSTSTALNLDQTTIVHGTPVIASVNVTASGGTPTGDVALVSTATPQMETGVGELTLANGSASGTIGTLPGGQYNLTARYAGDGKFASSTSPAVSLNVTPESSVVTITGSNCGTVGCAFGGLVSGGSYPYGSYMTFHAQATGVHAAAGTTDGTATGTITISDSASTGTISSGMRTINSDNYAFWHPAGLLAGTHSLVASYSGDASFNPSSSAPFTFTLTKANPLVSSRALPQVIATNGTTALQVALGVPTYGPSPTGSVTFMQGTTVLGTGQLTPCASSTSGPCSMVNYSSGYSIATLNVSGFALGTYTVTASYSGDTNFNPVTSSPFTFTVEQPASLAVTMNPTSINQLQSTTMTATVAGVPGVAAPTGGIFFDAVGPGMTWTGALTLTNGSVSFNFPGNAFKPGTVNVQVTYEGDSNYASISVSVPFTVTAPFSISGTPVTFASGATTGNTSTITVTPLSGFTGAVSMGCAVTSSPTGATRLPRCTITNPVTIVSSAVTATMTITSTATTTGSSIGSPAKPSGWIGAGGALSLAGLLLLGIPARRRGRRILFGVILLIACAGCITACGGHGSSGGSTPIQGTAPGSYTFTVTGVNQGVSVSSTVAVTIQ